jgi:microcystin degradation protein MlrC
VFTGDDWGRDGHTTYSAEVTVLGLHDGPVVGRRGIVAGKTLTPGQMALLDLGGVQVVVTSHTAVGNDPIFSEALGVDLSTIRTIVVKVRSSFPVAYDEFVAPEDMLFVDTPGRTSPMLHRMPFERLPRPVHPLDDDVEWANPLASPRSASL